MIVLNMNLRCALTLCVVILLASGCASSPEPSKEEKLGELYLASGTTDLLSQDFTSSLSKLQQAQKYLPKNPEVWNALGLAYFGKRDFKKSEESFRRALTLNPQHNFSRNNLGSLYLEQGKYAQAQREFELVAKDLAFVEQYKTLYNLGVLNAKQGQRLKAEHFYQRSLKENPNFCQAWLKLAELQLELGKREDAVNSLRTGTEGLCYSFTEAHYKLGLLLVRNQELDQARSKFEEIQQRFPNSPWAKLSEQKLRTLTR